MSRLSRLQARLNRVNARIAEIEAATPDITKIKSYSVGFGEASTTYQDYGKVAEVYLKLLREQESLEEQIADLSEYDATSSSVAQFRAPS